MFILNSRKKRYFIRHIYNHNYFEQIDSIDKAYFLGFVFADGYINKSGLYLNIALKDKEILYSFANFLDNNGDIISFIDEKYIRLALYSQKISSDLSKLGAFQQKSEKLLPPNNISPEYISHFIRGFFDGNGSIYFDKRNKSYGIEFMSTKPVLEWIESYFNIRKKLVSRNANKTVWRLTVRGNKQIRPLLDKIYFNSIPELRLSRKYDLYLKYLREHG